MKIKDNILQKLDLLNEKELEKVDNFISLLTIESIKANQQIKKHKKTSLELLEESGLIGCINGESNLSSNYKSVLNEGINYKYDHS